MPERNFLLGYGERLTERIAPTPGGAEKRPPYEVLEARNRLVPMVAQAVREIQALPEGACPRNKAVGVITLHPEYLAKSYFPGGLLQEVGFEPVGSRPTKVKPEKWAKKREPEVAPATELFVAASRENLRAWERVLRTWNAEHPGAQDLPKIESFRAFGVEEKLKSIPKNVAKPLLEVVLHAGPGESSEYILDAFETYARDIGVDAQLTRRLYAGGLCFLPVRAAREVLRDLAKFSFLRVARQMASLRPMNPVVRSFGRSTGFSCSFPDEDAVDPGLHVAVFDGGMRNAPELSRWVKRYKTEGVGQSLDEYRDHGTWVTSALLFGPIEKGEVADRPFAVVDHYRVLDVDSGRDEDLYDVLHRIRNVLQDNRYEFVNLSIGPAEPIEDDDVHGWTAVLDDLFCDGNTLATIAVGNGGEQDAALRFNRVQVPSDCVNALSVGAADIRGNGWGRASYSSVGPGRSPGLVKPDVLSFGGSDSEPFWVVDGRNSANACPQAGTSFASPLVLRMGIGIRAHFGTLLGPLAIRALLVHGVEEGNVERAEGGWGRVPEDLDSYVVCPEGTARVVYQGELTPAQYLRARIPLPAQALPGNVTIRATFCYATETDPDHPGNYTRSGLDIVFRPHDQKFDPKAEDPTNPKTDAFFQLKEFSTEAELRRDAHKWETTLHRERTKRGASLRNPAFDVHYNAREGSAPARTTDKIRYALVITVSAPRVKDLYNQVVRRYRTQIRPLVPVVQIPIRTRG